MCAPRSIFFFKFSKAQNFLKEYASSLVKGSSTTELYQHLIGGETENTIMIVKKAHIGSYLPKSNFKSFSALLNFKFLLFTSILVSVCPIQLSSILILLTLFLVYKVSRHFLFFLLNFMRRTENNLNFERLTSFLHTITVI